MSTIESWPSTPRRPRSPQASCGSTGVEVLAERVTVDARAHAEQLTPNVLAALADAGLTINDLGAVVVGCGPGPFTGLRVGMATAAAYGHALGIPVHGVCSLDAIGIESTGSSPKFWWSPTPAAVRCTGRATATASGSTGRRERPGDVPADVSGGRFTRPRALFDLPLAAVYPTASGLVRAVPTGRPMPAPLIPLYLRRPDAKPSAVTR